MREKYETLSLTVLRELAKARGIRGISGMRKPELIDRMVEEDEKEAAAPQAQTEAAGGSAYVDSGIQAQTAAPVRTEPAVREREERTSPAVSQQVDPVRQERPATVYANSGSPAGEMQGQTRSGMQDGGTRGVRETGGGYSARPVQRQEGTASPSSGRMPQRQLRQQPVSGQRGFQNRAAAQTAGGQQPPVQGQTGYTTVPTPLDAPVPAAPAEYSQEHTEHLSNTYDVPVETVTQLDSGERANGILEVMQDGFGFIRCENYLPGENDIYVSPSQIRRFNLKTGDIVQGNIRIKTQGEKFSALLYVTSINGYHPSEGQKRYNFEDMTPVFPDERLRLERPGGTTAMRVVDLISPIGKGQRGMIVSPPKAGKTTLLKDVAKSILRNTSDMHLIILLIDERPEEVTDIKEAIYGPNVEVIYSTFDELPEHHRRVSEMVIERARRLVEHKKDVTILLDSITRLARAYNLVIPPSGRTLSGGLDPAALHMPKRFFGAARNMREGGSLTILATALVDTGSKMDDVIYEEFKGTGNMELVLDSKLQERRIFPAIDIQKSGTRREDLLLSKEEQEAVYTMRKALNGLKSEDAAEQILNMFARTHTNAEFVQMIKKNKIV